MEKALSYLLHAGYLKAKRKSRREDKFLLSIPNREITHIYINILENWFNKEQKTGDLVLESVNSLLENDMVSFEIYLQDLIIANTSYMIQFKKYSGE